MDAIRDLDPGYFAFVMATGIISTGTYLLGPSWLSRTLLVVAAAGLAAFATGLWSLGLVLYLLLVALILLRWLTVAMTPRELGPPYWILMGATAITVLAGAEILGLPGTLPAVRATAGFVEGFSYALWAFGTWWIPLLVVLGFWRHVRHRWPLTYEPSLWSAVFPLGIYSVATLAFGQMAGIPFMEPLARFMTWVAVAAWILVAAAFLRWPAGHR
jgi:tellurite resistance protein TehA-like permease